MIFKKICIMNFAGNEIYTCTQMQEKILQELIAYKNHNSINKNVQPSAATQ
ncbi:hypothetical protein GpSGHVEth135 [Glossina pallidipes salivary gland hypertrophy virus]|uniref:Uncharacterized protein n=1 Tax=Glossina hytrovirus (isolate Glossina pallidipes/Ethiopia/Seibersdorf/-) TaxID=379529 RepID=A0A0Y0G7J9_GHVS|nr:hypothetical protein GpSGHVEth135 [Glossina pallidipes salivary gland hypertrophy virus]